MAEHPWWPRRGPDVPMSEMKLPKPAPKIGERWRVGDYVVELTAHDGDAMIGKVVDANDARIIGKQKRISDLDFRFAKDVERVIDDG